MNASTGEGGFAAVYPGMRLVKVRLQLLGKDVVFKANRIKLYRAKDLETGGWIKYTGQERLTLLIDDEVHPRLRTILKQPALNCELPVDHADTLGEDLASTASAEVICLVYQYPWRCFLLPTFNLKADPRKEKGGHLTLKGLNFFNGFSLGFLTRPLMGSLE